MNKELIQNLSLSYEISLAIGNSLDLKKMLHQLITTIVRKTAAHRGVVWMLENGSINFVTASGFGVKEYSPKATAHLLDTMLPTIKKQGTSIITRDNPHFDTFCAPKNGREKEVVLITLEDQLIIQLIYSRSEVQREGLPNVIRGLGKKIINSVLSCLNYQKLIELERKERNRLAQALYQSEKRYRLLTEKVPVGVFMMIDDIIIYANPKFAEIFGYRLDEIVNKLSFKDLVIGNSELSHILSNNFNLLQPLEENSTELFCYRKNGTLIICECMTIRIIYNNRPAIVGTLVDVTERHKAKAKLQYMATHDSLTSAYNRTYLDQIIYQSPGKDIFPAAVILCDVDGLKSINDTYGHKVGDQVLKQACNIIESCLRPKDILCRFGGDEFVALLPHTGRGEANRIINDINEAITHYNNSTHGVHVSMSIGLGIADNPALIDEAFNEADSNMYTIKAASLTGLTGRFILTLLEVLSARNLETKSHTLRVKNLSMQMGMAIGLDNQQLSSLSLLAMVHDIGKIGIPDSILLKPSKFTEAEMIAMTKHVEIGYNIANSFNELAKIAPYILHHHEHWNGNGYPHGLKGRDIPIICRILSIVDAYDAMTNHRPYRKAITKEEALSKIKLSAGIQFDPDLVEVFINLQQNIK
ncbi:diguanylate cyclase [Desulfofalx alkaliphila]|uniref:sensor domain-containing diguanylate cyclase/phosphohydrolase n=1 Tax=Desulfofalx alkaliphila TaxID=105483 RepID=UPI0004E14EFB|nr:HD domain-containing phosphohydrolase [Desulfofalx alkaliphila]